MGLGFDHTKYKTILFLDTNAVLETKPLDQLPWTEIDPDGPVLLLFVPQVLREIDRLKRDGRVAKRARSFNRLIKPAATNGHPVTLCGDIPRVDLFMAQTGKIDWAQLDDLDPDEPDAKVVAQVIHAIGVPNEKKLFLAYDINPVGMASRHDIKVKSLAEHWLLEPEPSPQEKELKKARQRIALLETNQPEMRASLAFEVSEPLMLYRVVTLNTHEQEILFDHIYQVHPKRQQERSLYYSAYDHDSGYDDRYAAYRDERLPAYTAGVHKILEDYYSQIPFRLTVSNDGHIQAENLIVKLTAKDGQLRERFRSDYVWGPPAPTPRTGYFAHLNVPRLDPADMIRPPPNRHEVIPAYALGRTATAEFQCGDFRHGREWVYEGVARVFLDSSQPFVIEIEVTASNMRGSKKTRSTVDFVVKDAKISELVDIVDHRFVVRFPMQSGYEKAVRNEHWDWFETLSHEDDD